MGNRQGEGKNSVGNVGGRGWAGQSGVGGEWDNCNSIINKYIFLKRKSYRLHQKSTQPNKRIWQNSWIESQYSEIKGIPVYQQ